MKYILNIILILPMLAGCSRPGTTPVQPLQVKIPVAVACAFYPVPVPEWNIPHLAQDASPIVKLKAELADLELARGYIGELKAALDGCS